MGKLPTIVAVLRRFRELQRITQEEMSTRTGIAIATVQRIESGTTKMNIEQMQLYLDKLDITLIDVELATRRGDYSRDATLVSSVKLLSEKQKRAIQNLITDLL
ncbi:helix-turn-helix domain-containing protein [Aliivibrio salmonicida]|uniref:helix-turn-helix domain-containing protein n=1 Tax=Aliivibrio salmonicida TaxID=40269 RepID=UPI003D0AAEBE